MTTFPAKALKMLLNSYKPVPVLSEKCLSAWNQVIWGLESKPKCLGLTENKPAPKQHISSNTYHVLSKKTL